MTLEITLTAFNIWPCIFRSGLKIFKSHFRLVHFTPDFCFAFFHFYVSKSSGLEWLSEFLTIFSLLIGVWMALFIILAKLLPIGSPGWWDSLVSLLCVSVLDDRCFLLAFLIWVSPWLLPLFLSTSLGPWGVSGKVNSNCIHPCRSLIWVDANCSYPWTPINLIYWEVFIKAVSCFYLRTDSVDIFLLVFCKNLRKITHNVCLFCCEFI